MIIKSLLVIAALLLCSTAYSREETTAGYRQFNVMAVNDIYNIEGIDAGHSGSMARLRSLRKQLSKPGDPVLLLHAGDFLFPSSMSSQYKGAQMVDTMNGLDGDFDAFDERFFVVFGNHEFDKGKQKYAAILAQRIAQSGFYWLGTNVHLNGAASSDSKAYQKALINNKIIEINGIKVGIFGITTDIAIPEYATIDGDYLAVSKRNIKALRSQGAEVVLAVTHLRISQDEQLLKQLGEQGPDVIFGGHEHARQHVCVGTRCVIKADADARSATVATISVSALGQVEVSHHFAILDNTTITSDPLVLSRTEHWVNRYQREYCQSHQQDSNCLRKVIGKTDVELVAEELEIRRFETNLGSFAADKMISAFDNITLPEGKKVQISLLNAGSLRLNQNIPAGTELNEWYLNGIFQYPVSLRLIEISGKQLKQVVAHSIGDWTGNGRYLQISGFGYRHNTETGKASDISLIDRQGNVTPVKDDERILASVNSYIADPSASDQDGYTMLNLDNEVVYGLPLIELKDVVRSEIAKLWQQGKAINPKTPGRVCNSQRPYLPCAI